MRWITPGVVVYAAILMVPSDEPASVGGSWIAEKDIFVTPCVVTVCLALGSFMLPAPTRGPLVVAGLLLALAGIALVQANGYWRLRDEVRRSRDVQRLIDEVSRNLPVVVFQARRARDGEIHIELLAGDTPQLFSATPRELQDDPSRILAAIHAADHKRVLSVLLRAVRRICPVALRFSAEGVRGPRHVAMHAWPRLEASSEQCWTGYWMDVSDADARAQAILRAHAQAAADAAEREQMVSSLGTGIGAPMHVLLQRLARLRGAPLDAHQRAVMATLDDAASMLGRILDDVAALSAGRAEGMDLQDGPVDLRALVQSVEALLRPVAQSKGLYLHQRVGARVAPQLLADATRLRQVLFNLVGNAVKFTRHGGVSLSLQALEDTAHAQRLRLVVADTGVGIALERQEAVFEPFAQAERSTTRQHGGSGLGLGICRQLVTAMGGTLALRSVPGQGTVVEIELELQHAPVPLAGDAVASNLADPGCGPDASRRSGSSPRVLVAEDHPTQQLLMQWWLRGMGLDVEVAGDGLQALASWRRDPPRLLFTDEQMPGLNGAGLVQHIRREEQQRGRAPGPIIGMTADIDGMRGMALDHLLAKPISRRTLHDAIAKVAPGLLAAGAAPAAPCVGVECSDAPTLASLVARFGTEDAARQLVQTLRASLEEDGAALQEAWHRADQRMASQRLHRMAGGVGSLGLAALSTHLRELNEAQVPPSRAQRDQLHHRLQRCIAHLRQLEG